MTEPRGERPPRWLRRLLVASLPDDGWAREFIAELDREFAATMLRYGRRHAGLWYARQLASRQTLRFVWLMVRRRRVGAGRGTMVGGTGTSVVGWSRDFRQAARGLAREGRFTLAVTFTLCLGIGANAAMFGVADRLFLRGPAHVTAPGELVRLYLHFEASEGGAERATPLIPYLTGAAIREESRTFRGLAQHRTEEVLAEVGGQTRPVVVGTVGPGYFDVLGTVPRTGRFFGTAAAPDETDVAVLSHALWLSAFGGASSALGTRVNVGGRGHTIVGVAPERFTGPFLTPVDVWVPLDRSNAANRNWQIVGRLTDVDGAALAARDADAVHARTEPGRFFGWARAGTIITAPIAYDAAARPPAEAAVARLLILVAGLVLLIGVANVANLSLARLTRRRREVAVRLALGIGRWRLTRLLLAESLLLSFVAGAASLPVTYGAGVLLRRVLLPQVAWDGSPLQARILGVALLTTLATGLLVALLPVRHAGRTDVSEGLRAGGRTGGGRRVRLHLALAATQVTLAAALLLGAGLFLKSFDALRVTDLGVDAAGVTAVIFRTLEPGAIRSPSEEEFTLYSRALDAVAADPGVEVAAVTLGLPFLFNFGLSIFVPGRDSIPELPGGGPYLSAVTDRYFDATGTSLLQGRGFTAEEVASRAPLIVVSRSLARTLWTETDAIGRCVRVGSAESPCATVIGVAEDVHRVGYREPPSMQYYVPLTPGGGFGGLALVLRLRANDGATLARVRASLERIDPVIDYVEMTKLETVLAPQVRAWRLGAWVLGMSAGVAVLVSMIGVYGVLSYLVEQRRREIGVRIALGASRAGIHRMVLRQGLQAAGLGLTTGIAITAAGARWIQPLLFETAVLDPLVLSTVATVLLAAASLACLIPAGRASSVEPAECLNEE